MRKIFTVIFALLLASSLKVEVSAQTSFTSLNGIPGASVKEIHKDASGNLYTVDRSAGQIYRSTDGGGSWSLFDVGSTDVYAFYADGADLYYFLYDTMFKSVDGGSTWTRVNSLFSRYLNIERVHKSPVSPTTWIVEGPCEGVFVSTDGGVTWTDLIAESCGNTTGNYQLTINNSGDIFFVDEGQGLYRHKNPVDGIWDESKLELVFPKVNMSDRDFNLYTLVSGSNRIFLRYESAMGDLRLASSTSGDNGTFADFTLPNTPDDLNQATLSLNSNGNIILDAQYAYLTFELSDESTPTWVSRTHPFDQIGSNSPVYEYWFSASEGFATSYHFGIVKSSNGGATWQRANGSGNNALISGYSTDVEVLTNQNIVVFPGYVSNGVWVSTDQGNSFQYSSFGAGLTSGASIGRPLTKLQDNSLIVNNDGTTLRSTDGFTWNIVSATESADIYLPVPGGDVYFFRGYEPSLNKTNLTDLTDGGDITLTPMNIGLPGTGSYRNVVRHDSDFYLDWYNDASNEWEIWKIETQSEPFTSQKLLLPFAIDNMAGMVSVSDKLYISNGSEVAYSTNQGANWTSIDYADHSRLIAIDQEGGGIGLSSPGGFAVSQDDGKSWTTIAVPGNGIIYELTQDSGNNFIASVQGGSVAKFTDQLVVNSSELPADINITWEPLNGPFGGSLDGMVKDSQDNLFAFSHGAGVFELPSGSSTWQKVETGIGEGKAVYVADNDDIYAATYSQLVRSTDNGASWSMITDGQVSDIANLVVANNGNIIVSSNQGGEGIYVSSDDGASYTKPLGPGSKGTFIDIVKSGSGRIWTHQWNNDQSTVHTSNDNGLTWNVLNSIDLTNKRLLSINRLEGNAVALVTEDDIGYTTDDGVTWSSIKGSIDRTEVYETYPGLSKVYLAPDNSYLFYNLDEVYISNDQGSTWTLNQTLSYSGTAFTSIVWRGNDIVASAGQNSGIRLSVGGTSAWSSNLLDGLSAFFRWEGDVFGLGNKLYASGSGGGDYFESSDDGQSFMSDGDDEYWDRITKDPLGKLIRYGSGVSFSTDNGLTWSTGVGNGYIDRLVSGDGLTYYASRDNNGREIVRSTDLVNWTAINPPEYPISNHGANFLAVLGTDILYVHGYNDAKGKYELYKFSFGGVELITDSKVQGAQQMQFTDDKVILYRNDGKLTFTTDGINWIQRAAPPAPNGPVFRISENGYYFIHDYNTGRLWVSKDEGINWQFTDGFLEMDVYDIEINPGNGFAYAAINGRVAYKSKFIVLENDGVDPQFAASDPFDPSDGTLDLELSQMTLSIEFDEIVKGVNGKNIRILEVDNPTSPIRTYDATDATLSIDGKTAQFTVDFQFDYSTQYFVTMEAGSFTDIFGNPAPQISANTGAGTFDWDFTTVAAPDNTKPTVSLTTSDLAYVKGTPKVFEVNATDNNEVDAQGATIFYRKISDPASTNFKTAGMTASGTDSPNLDFNVTSSDSWFDAIGLEFYFEVSDKAGNLRRFPEEDDSFLYSYTDYSANPSKIEGLSFGETERSYRIMAVPYDLVDPQISTQFSDLGEAKKANFRIGTYNNAKGDYDEYPETLSTVGRGRGYWILMKNFTDIEPANATAPENNRDNFFKMSLQQGWNQIGNPYPVPISWEEIRDQDSNVGQLKTYNNGNFSNGDVLNPYQGGFVYADAPVQSLVIRFQGITTGGRKAGRSYDLASDNWQLDLAIEQGEFTNAIGGIGMDPEAVGGKDYYDDFNPPTITHRLELRFDNEDDAPMAKSVVKTETNHDWSFTAHAEGTAMVALKWDNSNFGDNTIGLWLYDEERVAYVDMRANNEYRYLTTPSKKFKIYYGELPELEIAPSFSLLGEPWPNPSSDKLTIPFALTNEHGIAEVVINIYDAKGRLVQELTNQSFNPGTHQVEWLPNRTANEVGLHLIQWNVITENGDQLQETKRVIVK